MEESVFVHPRIIEPRVKEKICISCGLNIGKKEGIIYVKKEKGTDVFHAACWNKL